MKKLKPLFTSYCSNGLYVDKEYAFIVGGSAYIRSYNNIMHKTTIEGLKVYIMQSIMNLMKKDKENILKTMEDQDLKDTVILLGLVSPEEVCHYYMASDIFVFSSQSETQGMVILEAMAGKCAVVAIRSSGIDDIICNGYNGFKTKADLDLWSEKVIYLMEHPEILIEMSQNAYDFSNKFSLEAMAETTVEVYQKAIVHKKTNLMDNSKVKILAKRENFINKGVTLDE